MHIEFEKQSFFRGESGPSSLDEREFSRERRISGGGTFDAASVRERRISGGTFDAASVKERRVSSRLSVQGGVRERRVSGDVMEGGI